jgi:alkylhydroperoxidase/carboxymuconolactone decarboxylase family protein YurZ
MLSQMNEMSITELRAEAEALTADRPVGEALDTLSAALVGLAVAVSVTALDRAKINDAIHAAMDAGASIAQVQEIIALVSGLGVHSLMVSSVTVLDEAAKRGLAGSAEPLDADRQQLWDKHVGNDPFWDGFSEELPGFLEAMLRLSPDIFVGFFDYCAIPWRSGTVKAKTKELAALACDASPSHRFRPGFRVHLKNAIKLGVGRAAIFQALDIAAAAPEHRGTD